MFRNKEYLTPLYNYQQRIYKRRTIIARMYVSTYLHMWRIYALPFTETKPLQHVWTDVISLFETMKQKRIEYVSVFSNDVYLYYNWCKLNWKLYHKPQYIQWTFTKDLLYYINGYYSRHIWNIRWRAYLYLSLNL